MKRAFITICMTLIVALSLTGCGGESPKKVAESAVAYELDGDLDNLYALLSSDDQSVSLENFKQRYSIPEEYEWIFNLIPNSREKVKPSKFKSNTLTGQATLVTFVITVPDLTQSGNITIEDLLLLKGKRFNSLDELPEELVEKIRVDIEKKGLKTKEITQELRLIREGDTWRVHRGIAHLPHERTIPSILHTPQMLNQQP